MFTWLRLVLSGDRPTMYSKLEEHETARSSLESVAQEEQHLLARIQALKRYVYGLLCLTLLLSVTLAGQLAWNTRAAWTSPSAVPVPEMPKQMKTFERSPIFASVSTSDSDLAWTSLIPPGKGFVNVDDPGRFDLPPGMTHQKHSGELYNVAVFHQLYCLSSIRDYLWHLKFAVDRNQTEQLRPILLDSQETHVVECFDYIRQSLMCSGDTTLEYPGAGDQKDQIVDGWGVRHQCVDWDAILHYTASNTPAALS